MQQRLDGIEVNLWMIRFAGTHDLDAAQAEEMRLDGTILVLAAGRAGQATFDVLDSGDVRRKNALKVSDFIILSGEQRDLAISALANGTAHGVLSPPQWGGEEVEGLRAAAADHGRLARFLEDNYADVIGDESAGELAVRLLSDERVAGVVRGRLATVDTDTGEPSGLPEPHREPEPEIPEPQGAVDDDGGMGSEKEDQTATGPVERLGHVNDRSRPLSPDDAPRGDGPKVGRFNPDTFDDPAPDGAVEERQQLGSVYSQPSRRDPVLARFLEEDAPQ